MNVERLASAASRTLSISAEAINNLFEVEHQELVYQGHTH